jgi:DNA-binding NarL/FixJ family response regulator
MRAMTLSSRSNAEKPWTSEELDVLRRMAAAGATKNEVADQLGRTIVSVSARAEKLQVSIRENSGLRRLRQRGELRGPE